MSTNTIVTPPATDEEFMELASQISLQCEQDGRLTCIIQCDNGARAIVAIPAADRPALCRKNPDFENSDVALMTDKQALSLGIITEQERMSIVISGQGVN